MAEPWESAPPAPEVVVGAAIQDLAAARLARSFMPLVGAFAIGVAQLIADGPFSASGLALVLGAPAAAAATLAHGVRIVQRAFGRPPRPWMALASVGTLIPPTFGLYVLAWRGLREVAVGVGPGAWVLGAVFTGLGVWALRTWMKLNELQLLARAMVPWGDAEPPTR